MNLEKEEEEEEIHRLNTNGYPQNRKKKIHKTQTLQKTLYILLTIVKLELYNYKKAKDP